MASAMKMIVILGILVMSTSWAGHSRPRFQPDHGCCYRRDRLIAKGSQARVYEATPCTADHPVAIKTMDMDDPCSKAEMSFLRRFGRSKNYRGIPRLFDLFESKKHVHVVIQYFEGVPLTNWALSSWKSMSDDDLKLFEDRVMMVFYKVIAVLNMVHDAGQIHLDIKPRNILVDRLGNVMVLDFGGLKMESFHCRHIQPLSMKYMYTNGYVAPELHDDRWAGYASDIYSLGCSCERLVSKLDDRVSELLPRLDWLISLTKKKEPKLRPTAKELLVHEVFRPERQRYYEPGDNVTSIAWLEKLVALKGPNKYNFRDFPITRDRHSR